MKTVVHSKNTQRCPVGVGAKNYKNQTFLSRVTASTFVCRFYSQAMPTDELQAEWTAASAVHRLNFRLQAKTQSFAFCTSALGWTESPVSQITTSRIWRAWQLACQQRRQGACLCSWRRRQVVVLSVTARSHTEDLSGEAGSTGPQRRLLFLFISLFIYLFLPCNFTSGCRASLAEQTAMDPLDFFEREDLLQFLRVKKTEISLMEKPKIFLEQLLDHNMIPEDRYEVGR